jgi:hypothetical protein
MRWEFKMDKERDDDVREAANDSKEIGRGQQIIQKDHVFSLRQLAAFFDCFQNNGEPATETIRDWLYSGRIPPPDIRISRKAMYWKHETIVNFINVGGLQ